MHRIMILLCFFSTQLISQSTTDNWFTDLEAAKSYAEANEGQILMVFAGSDWCKPCIQFKKDILNSSSFIEYTNNKTAILYLDFPARKKNRLSKEQTTYNEALAEKYNRQGAFPKIVLLDKDESILNEPEFNGQSPEDFISELKQSTK